MVFGLAAAASFLLYLHRYTWNLIRPELEAEYHFSNIQLESLGSAFFLPYAAGQIPSGILCDLFGPHLFLVAIILLWSLLLPFHGWGGSYTSLYLVRTFFGAAQAGCYPALSLVTRLWFPIERRTQVQGWIASAFGRGGGAMASLVMGSLLMGWWGLDWVTALLVLSGTGVVLAGLFLFFFRNRPAEQAMNLSEAGLAAGGQEAAKVLPFRVALANRSYLVLLLQQFLNAGADVVFALLLGSYLRSLGTDRGVTLGVLVSLPLWGGALGGIFGGYANDWAIRRFGNRRWCRSLIAGGGLGIGSLCVLVTTASSDPVWVALGLMTARFFADWNQPTMWGTCTDLGGRFSATVFAIGNMMGNLGAYLTPFAVGLLLDYFSVVRWDGGVMIRDTNYVPAFVLCSGMMSVAAGCWFLIDCTQTLSNPRNSDAGDAQ
jgi:MFS family permease